VSDEHPDQTEYEQTQYEQPPYEQAQYVSNRQWLADHIGRLAGLVLGLIAVAFVVFLAFIGSKPAFGLVVVVVAGLAMIGIGGLMRGEMRSH
jgi:VIT1/CCC1 family predicted Fe2+/Mn2+ transporter